MKVIYGIKVYNVVAFANTYNFDDPEHNNDLTQCWTKENMRAVTSPSTGSYLVKTVGKSSPRSYRSKIADWPGNDSIRYALMNYGVLYNWNAALDVYHRDYSECDEAGDTDPRRFFFIQEYPRGICPLGWHVSRSLEWTSVEVPLTDKTFAQLESINGPRYGYYNADNVGGYYDYGNKMVSGIWDYTSNNCRIGGNTCEYRNASDLSVLPACSNSDVVYIGHWAYFWTSEASRDVSSTQPYQYASDLTFYESSHGPTHEFHRKNVDCSVRCVKDYDDSYTSPGRALYYYGYNGTSLTMGFETNPSTHVARRGVIYSTDANSPLEIANPLASNLVATDGANVEPDTTDPDADKNFEILINYEGNTYLRVFLIDDDGNVVYGQRVEM